MKLKLGYLLGLTTLLFMLVLAFPADGADSASANSAEETKESSGSWFMDWAMQDYMLGDWGGARTKLQDKGIDFEFVYFASNPWNMTGGIETGDHYQGTLLMTLDLDSEKLVGYEGGHFRASGLWLHGQDHFSDRHIGDFNKVNLIDFPNDERLWELWYGQELFDGKLTLKAGQMLVDSDFMVPQFYNQMGYFYFLNQTFFFPTLAFNVWDRPAPFPVEHHALASSPYGAPGALIRVDPIDELYLQAAVYDGLPDTRGNGTSINLNSDEGALAYFEVGYKLNQQPGDDGLPGNYKLGGFYHTDDFADNRSAVLSLLTGPPIETHSGSYGGYLLVDQVLYLEEGKDDPAQQGLAGFFRVTGAPADRNLTQFGIDGGLLYKGPIPTRDYDSIGIAASYLEMSDDIADALRDFDTAVPGIVQAIPDYEAVIELNYRAQMTAWWSLHASVQHVIHPAGRLPVDSATFAVADDAWAFVLMSTFRF